MKLLPRFIVHFFFFVVVGGLFVEKLNNFGASAVCGNFSHIFHGRTVCLFSIFFFFVLRSLLLFCPRGDVLFKEISCFFVGETRDKLDSLSTSSFTGFGNVRIFQKFKSGGW